MRFGCRVSMGVLLFIATTVGVLVAQEFPIIVYGDPFSDQDGYGTLVSDTGNQITLLKNMGVTHVIGWARKPMVDLAASRNIKVVASNGAIRYPYTHEDCLPHCNAIEENFYTHSMLPISSYCPKYLEWFTDWGYKTDFEVEEGLINHNKGYAFKQVDSVSEFYTDLVTGAQGYRSLASDTNYKAGYMFTGPQGDATGDASRQFSPKAKDTTWCRADFIMNIPGDVSGDPNTVVAYLVVATPNAWCRWCDPYRYQPCPSDFYYICTSEWGGSVPPITEGFWPYLTDTYVDFIPLKVDTVAPVPYSCDPSKTVTDWSKTYLWVREITLGYFLEANKPETLSLPYLQTRNNPYIFQVYWTKEKDLFVNTPRIKTLFLRVFGSVGQREAAAS